MKFLFRKIKRKLPLPTMLFLGSFLAGAAAFLLPVYYREKWTVPFDVGIQWVKGRFPLGVELYTLLLLLYGAGMSLAAARFPQSPGFRKFSGSRSILFWRITGALLGVGLFFGWVPSLFPEIGIPRLIWKTLAVSVALIIPPGAVLVQLFVEYGGMEFLGTLARPLMKPLFRLPGRAALDALTSWIGSYSVGLYLTRTVFLRGGYSRREAFTIATCFSTVSVGFVGVVCATLDLLPFFPLVLALYGLLVALLAAILVRIPPISRIPDTGYQNASVERSTPPHTEGSLWRQAWRAALLQVNRRLQPVEGEANDTSLKRKREWRQSLPGVLLSAFQDGLDLAASILGTIVSVGALALLLARATPLFDWLGRPLLPLLNLLGIPAAPLAAPAVLAGITEMYIPVLLVVDAPLATRFFIALLSVSQLIFFSSLGPMILDMFQDIPVRLGQLIQLFFLRTLLLLPLLALILKILGMLGFF